VQRLDGEQHEPHAEHAVDPEQCGVAVQRRGVEPLHVIQRDRGVDHEAEQTGADQVPERERAEPAVLLIFPPTTASGVFGTVIVVGFDGHGLIRIRPAGASELTSARQLAPASTTPHATTAEAVLGTQSLAPALTAGAPPGATMLFELLRIPHRVVEVLLTTIGTRRHE